MIEFASSIHRREPLFENIGGAFARARANALTGGPVPRTTPRTTAPAAPTPAQRWADTIAQVNARARRVKAPAPRRTSTLEKLARLADLERSTGMDARRTEARLSVAGRDAMLVHGWRKTLRRLRTPGGRFMEG